MFSKQTGLLDHRNSLPLNICDFHFTFPFTSMDISYFVSPSEIIKGISQGTEINGLSSRSAYGTVYSKNLKQIPCMYIKEKIIFSNFVYLKDICTVSL